MDQVWAVILAGGASARFWPCDGDHQPKYLLRPAGGDTLLRRAWQRALRLTGDPSRVVVMTGEAQAGIVRVELPDLHPSRLICEPARRDTLPAAALGMAAIQQWDDTDPVVCVLPADSFLEPSDAPAQALEAARAVGLPDQQRLFSFTIAPTRPETGFGYLELAQPIAGGVLAVAKFHEKPNRETAERFLASGKYHWNLGSFVWRASGFWSELKRQQPAILTAARETWAALDSGHAEAAAGAFARSPAISIDYGVMEGAESVGAIPVKCEFDDVGTWDALAGLGGISPAEIEVESQDCLVRATDRVAFVGCNNLILVQERGRILVMARGSGQLVKQARQLAEGERRDPPIRAEDVRPGVMLGIDFGTVRTGVAACDDLGMLASPVGVVHSTEMAETAKKVAEIARERRASGAVIGMPFNMDGSEGAAVERVRRFAELLKQHGVSRIEFQDERLTSWEADAQLRDAGHFGRDRKERLDAASAALILEAWLKERRGPEGVAGGTTKPEPPDDAPWEKAGWQKSRHGRGSSAKGKNRR